MGTFFLLSDTWHEWDPKGLLSMVGVCGLFHPPEILDGWNISTNLLQTPHESFEEKLHPLKTSMTVEKTTFWRLEDVSPTQHGDFPACHVSFRGLKTPETDMGSPNM